MKKEATAVPVKSSQGVIDRQLRVQDARTVYAAFKRADAEAGFYALQLGIYLEWVKPQIAHGQFLPFVEVELQMTQRHARKFAEAARTAMKRKELMGLKPELLLGDGGAQKKKAAEQMLLDFIGDRSQTQLFNDLKGISHKKGELTQAEKSQEIRNQRRDILVNLRASCERVVDFNRDLNTEQVDTACARLLATLEKLTGVAWSPDPEGNRDQLRFEEHAHVYE